MNLKNTGTSAATITDVFINDQPCLFSATTPPNPASGNASWYAASTTIASGASATFVVVVENGGTLQPFTSLSSGTTINFKLHSAGGMDYLKLAELS
jgi:hypothetical protein